MVLAALLAAGVTAEGIGVHFEAAVRIEGRSRLARIGKHLQCHAAVFGAAQFKLAKRNTDRLWARAVRQVNGRWQWRGRTDDNSDIADVGGGVPVRAADQSRLIQRGLAARVSDALPGSHRAHRSLHADAGSRVGDRVQPDRPAEIPCVARLRPGDATGKAPRRIAALVTRVNDGDAGSLHAVSEQLLTVPLCGRHDDVAAVVGDRVVVRQHVAVVATVRGPASKGGAWISGIENAGVRIHARDGAAMRARGGDRCFGDAKDVRPKIQADEFSRDFLSVRSATNGVDGLTLHRNRNQRTRGV